jgi:LPS export ABC transporter permease LptF/LPS export ABC transporter permease LptG
MSPVIRRLDGYIFREIISYALLGLAVFTFIFFVPQLVRLMELVVRHSAGLGTIALLFACTLPAVLTFTVPMSVLVGTLIGLGRLSADSELVALQALGIDRRRLLWPVGALALATTLLTLAMTLWLGPRALARFHSIERDIAAGQASYQVQPRVFDERFPGLVLYVQDLDASATRWRGIFLAPSGADAASQITFAQEAIVVPDPAQGVLQLHLKNGTTHEFDRHEPNRYSVSTFGESDIPVAVGTLGREKKPELSVAEQAMPALLIGAATGLREARIELQRRLSFPAACLVFALLGVPLGVRPHRGGRAMGFVVTLLMICGYYLLFIFGAGLARRGAISPFLGMWSANIIAGALGLALVPGLDRIRSEGGFSAWYEEKTRKFAGWRARQRRAAEARPARDAETAVARDAALRSEIRTGPPPAASTEARNGTLAAVRLGRSFGFPLLIDVYLVGTFLYYFLLFLIGFLFLFHAFTFFELLEDIGRHQVPLRVVLNYFYYLTPFMIYQLLPVAALVGVLVTLGILSKNNEVTAFKAAGVSLYRLAVPMLAAGLVLALGMFVLDDTYLPEANQRQDSLRNQIKGRPARTFFQPRRQWIFGENAKLYNYELFDPDRNLFGGLNVFELDPQTFQLRRRVFATRGHWEEAIKTWILEEGWVRDLEASRVTQYVPFRVWELAELSEPPSYFNREVRPSSQLNWLELDRYIRDLQTAGFDVARLSVQWHKKIAFPLITPIIILLAIPFAFLVGRRGAVGGLAVGVGIGIIYWATSALFEALGAVGQLPPLISGWAPTFIFGFGGMYFFLRMKT